MTASCVVVRADRMGIWVWLQSGAGTHWLLSDEKPKPWVTSIRSSGPLESQFESDEEKAHPSATLRSKNLVKTLTWAQSPGGSDFLRHSLNRRLAHRPLEQVTTASLRWCFTMQTVAVWQSCLSASSRVRNTANRSRPATWTPNETTCWSAADKCLPESIHALSEGGRLSRIAMIFCKKLTCRQVAPRSNSVQDSHSENVADPQVLWVVIEIEFRSKVKLPAC